MPKRSRYVTEYKAKFKPINFEEAYRPPVLKPRAPLAIESPLLREIAIRESNEIKEITQPKLSGNTHQQNSVCKKIEPSESIDSGVNVKVPKQRLNSDEKKKPKDNRSLQYKAGLAHTIPRPGKENFLSEYQRQFNWKKPAKKESPIMSAEQVIFRSHEGVSPQVGTIGDRAKFSFKTEYQSQYVKHPWKQVKNNRSPLPPSGKPDHSDDSEDSGVHVSSPSPSPEKQTSHPKVPVKPFICQSEYQSNFNPPNSFQYANGVWVRAGPPHLHILQENLEHQDENLLSKAHTSWFQQVLELRKKAQKYKLLARDGSQALQVFRRERKEKDNALLPNSNCDSLTNECEIPRPVQPVGNHLLSNKEEQPTEKEKTVRSDSNENLKEICNQQTSPTSCKSESDFPGNRTKGIGLNKNADKLSARQQSSSPAFSICSSEHMLQRDERSPTDLSSSISSINLSEELNLSAGGRSPTPELLHTKDPRRHHLDVTTPSKGGPLLVSPLLDHVRRGPFIMRESDTCSSRTSLEGENSFLSQRAMQKRRALATKTFKRARRRRENLARRTGN